jgi:peptidoglycan/LPS O-acetylase OafA/YrhL
MKPLLKFYGRRALRILPLYYLYIFILAVMVVALPNFNFGPLASNFRRDFFHSVWYAFFYIYDFFSASVAYVKSWAFSHLWSLSVEEQFYLIWPLLIFMTPKKNLKKLFIAFIALGPIFRLITTLIFRNHVFPFLLKDPQQATYVLPLSHIDAFALGAYISRFEIPHPRLQLLGLVIIVPILGMLSDYLVRGYYVLATLGYELPLTGAFKEVWGYSLLNYLFAILIYCVVKTKLFQSDLSGSILGYLGKISYGLYVYHFFTIAVVVALLKQYGQPYTLGSPWVFWIALITTIVVASLSYFLLEKPILNLKSRFFTISSSTPTPKDSPT